MKQQRESLCPHELPDRPWSKVGTDLFVFSNREYLINVDYFSHFWEIDYLPDTKSSTVINKLKAQFARQGIPDIEFSDNGLQYTSKEFQQFSRLWEFQHKTHLLPFHKAMGKRRLLCQDSKTPDAESQDFRSRSISGDLGSQKHSITGSECKPSSDQSAETKSSRHETMLNERRVEMYYHRHMQKTWTS